MKNKKEPIWGWVDDDHISILWNIEDVKNKAKEMKINLNKKECREVLDQVLNNHDANYGTSWHDLEYSINDLFSYKKKAA
jgi:hypothetical protein